MKLPSQEKSNLWTQILSWMTATTTQSIQASIIQLVLATSIISVVIYALSYQVVYQAAPIDTLWHLVFLILLYAISRTQLHSIAAGAFICMLLFQQVFVLIPELGVSDELSYILTPAFALPVIAFIFQGIRQRIALTISGVFVILSLLWWMTQENSIVPVQVGLMIIVMTVAMMILFPFFDEFIYSNFSIGRLQHRNIIEQSPDLILIVENNDITYINPAGLQMLGTNEADDIIGKSLTEFMEGQSSDTSSGTYVTKTGSLNNLIVQSIESFNRLDGDVFLAMVTITPFDNHQLKTNLITAKPMHSAFNQTESLIESTNVVLAVVQDDQVVYINNEFERLTGFSKEAVYTQNSLTSQFIHDDDKPNVLPWMEQLNAGRIDNDTIEYRLLRKAGNPVWVRSKVNQIRYAGKPALLITAYNIDDYKSASLPIVDHLPYPTILIKLRQNVAQIVAVHQGRAEWLDLDDTVIGQPISEYIDNLPSEGQSLLVSTNNKIRSYTRRGILYLNNQDPTLVEWTVTGITNNPLADYIVTLRPSQYESQLEVDVKRYRAIFDMMNDYAFILRVLSNGDYEFVWVSKAFQSITGYDPYTDSANQILDTLYHPDDKAIITRHYEQLQKGEMAIHEYRIITKYGQVGWMREYAYPVKENDRVTLIYGSVRDVTSSIFTENTMRMYATQQAVIAEIGMVAVTNNLDSKEFASQALNLITQLMEVPWCVLIKYDKAEGRFSTYSMVGDNSQEEIESKPNDDSTYLGYVLQRNDTVLVSDWSKENRFTMPTAYKTLGIQSTLSVVVPMQNEPFGILNIHDSTLRQFTADNINMLQMVANIIGAYTQQRQSQIAEREHYMMAQALSDIAGILNSTTELEDILRIILNFVSQIVPVVDSSNIMLIDRERQTATITTRHNVNPEIPLINIDTNMALEDVPLFSEAVESGKPIIIDDVTSQDGWYVVPETRWIRSYLGAPIFADGECIGLVSLDSKQTSAFTLEHLEKMEAFLNHASIAIQNARHSERLVAEVKKRTQELQAERLQLQTFFDATGEGIFYSQDRDMLFVNSHLCQMMGYEEDELLEQSSTILRPNNLSERELQLRHTIDDDLQAFGRAQAEIRFRRKDGSTFMGAVTASTVNLNNELLAVTIVRDISEQKAIEAQKESFIAHAAHELRNPIASLNMRLYLMKKKDLITLDDLGKVEQIVNKMNSLVTGLLDLSRFGSGRIPLSLQSLILQDVLNDVHDIQLPEADQKGLKLNFEMPDEPINMIADDLRLYQVITNLVSNAIHYTPLGGNIDVTVEFTDVSHREIKIQVTDDGLGIPKDKQSNLFQPFYRVDNTDISSGTGLGLSICKQITEAHGGTISAESEEGKGACFTVCLPIDATDASSSDH